MGRSSLTQAAAGLEEGKVEEEVQVGTNWPTRLCGHKGPTRMWAQRAYYIMMDSTALTTHGSYNCKCAPPMANIIVIVWRCIANLLGSARWRHGPKGGIKVLVGFINDKNIPVSRKDVGPEENGDPAHLTVTSPRVRNSAP